MKGAEGIPRLGWVVAFLVFAVLCASVYSSLKNTRPRPVPARLAPISQVPDFHLLDQTGKPFGLGSLKGKIWVADFISTRCGGQCPPVRPCMVELDKAVARAGGGVVLVTFLADPGFGRPDVSAACSNKLGADPTRWKFLTGRQEDVEAVVVKGLLQPFVGETGGIPACPARIVLVDRDGRLRGSEDGNDPEAVQKLLMDIGDLMRESPFEKP